MSGFLAVLSAVWWFVSWPFVELFREREWINVPTYEDEVDDSTLECADVAAIRCLAGALAWVVDGLFALFNTDTQLNLEMYDAVDDSTLECADVAAIRSVARALAWGLLTLFALPSTSASGPLPSSVAASTQTAPPAPTYTTASTQTDPPRLTYSTASTQTDPPLLTYSGIIPSSIISLPPSVSSRPNPMGQVPSSMAPTFSTTRRPTTIPGPVPSLMVPKTSAIPRLTTSSGPVPSLMVPKTSTIPRSTTSSGPAPSSMGSINKAAAAPGRNYKRGFLFHPVTPPQPARPNIPVGPPPSAPTFHFESSASSLPAIPPPSPLNPTELSFGLGFVADAAETSRALNARAAAPVPAIFPDEKGNKPEETREVETEPELEKEEETRGEQESGGKKKKKRRRRRNKGKKNEEEGAETPVLEGGL